ncbi:MAG: Small-conductance mechanosensitive channel [uncultured Paraburkholderia sp.]|nr:MAG: Small-conductance mechanosensitive channel [uncultured Paraburkholderia sp.]
MLARSVMFVIVIVGGALMTFPNVRQIGASLLASAGVAGRSPVLPRARCSAT